MKLTIKFELKKINGEACDESEVFDALDTEWDGTSVFVQGADNEDVTEYAVIHITRVEEHS